MRKFKIGDRVKLINKDMVFFKVGETGTIRCFYEGARPDVGVEWDTKSNHRHSLHGNCKEGYGYYVFEEDLELEKIKSWRELLK